jgi:hypothetical protein
MPMHTARELKSTFVKKSTFFTSIILVLFVLAYSNLSFVAAAATSAQNPKLANLPPNTALSLGVYNSAPLAGCTTPTRTITAFSRLTYDRINHQILMFGGGHAATPRTDVDVLNLGTLTWTSAYSSTSVDDMNLANLDPTTGGWISTGHPTARHTYDMLTFAPNTGELILLTGNQLGSPCTAPDVQGNRLGGGKPAWGKVWHYNPVSKLWASGPASADTWSPYSASEYDPVSGTIIVIGPQGGPYGRFALHNYDPTARIALSHKEITLHGIYQSQNLVYFPPNDKFYYIQNNGTVFEVTLDRNDFAKSTIVELTGITGTIPKGEMPNVQGASGETGWAYDPVKRIIGGGIVDCLFYAFDPIGKTWTATSMRVSPTAAAVGKLAFHAIDYDTANNVFIFIDKVPTGGGSFKSTTWAYKYGVMDSAPTGTTGACLIPSAVPGTGGSPPSPMSQLPPPNVVPASSAPTGNGITITEQDGVSTDNYPVQIGRPFIQGQIRNYPVARINGVAQLPANPFTDFEHRSR